MLNLMEPNSHIQTSRLREESTGEGSGNKRQKVDRKVDIADRVS
jgi:hypothetical protein